VERHVEAEEDEFFAEAVEIMSPAELDELGRRITEMREELSEAA
jgi:hypothetical protein